GDDVTTANQMEVVLSEINWMGSYDPSGSNSSSEYIELYNTTSRNINISGWVVQCGNGGAFATTVMTAPAQTVIGPGQFMVFAQSTSNPLAQYHYQVGGWGAIPNTITDQCRLTDGAAGGNTVVDVAGVSGVAFTSIPARLGVNDSTNLVKRSMERTDLRASGANTTNWHSNSNSSYLQNLNFNSDRIDNTFGTPGYANSP
ncbi:MAG TPA: lamin tail domain-containing protein, partial [Leptospiraceae bacterium]|nr:lamin tail domain-containing protein [Leptospiraceae bacterium]